MIYLNILLFLFSFNSDLIKIERTADISNGHYFIDDTSLPFPFSPVTFFKFGFPDKSLVIVDIYKIEKEKQSQKIFISEYLKIHWMEGCIQENGQKKVTMESKLQMGSISILCKLIL